MLNLLEKQNFEPPASKLAQCPAGVCFLPTYVCTHAYVFLFAAEYVPKLCLNLQLQHQHYSKLERFLSREK
jgi:hypothetical protein